MSTPKLGNISFTELAESQTKGGANGKPEKSAAKPKPATKASRHAAAADEIIKMTVKLTRHDWERMQDLKRNHRLGFQGVAIAGINLFLKEEFGQPPLDMPAAMASEEEVDG